MKPGVLILDISKSILLFLMHVYIFSVADSNHDWIRIFEIAIVHAFSQKLARF